MRTLAVVIAAVLLAACGHACTSAVPVRALDRAAPDRSAPGLTHGGWIKAVTLTETGDAALTIDDLGGIRLWPSLDGKRPPVPVSAVGVHQMALGHAGNDLLAAFLSEAGGVLLVRVARDGAVRGRAQIPDDIACRSVIAIDDGVLVVRADQSIERYDADAKRRGRIVGKSGERIAAIATRRGGAVALIAGRLDDRDLALPDGTIVGEATLARQIVIGDGLAWGGSTLLPTPMVADRLALSPDQRRIAVVSRTDEVHVLDVATSAQVGQVVKVNNIDVAIGFTDDDHLAVMLSDIQWWQPRAAPTPPKASGTIGIECGAVGNGVAVGGLGATLVIFRGGAIHYLGWNRSALGDLLAVDSHIMLAVRDTVAWLDDRLALSSERDISGLAHALWIGPRHAVLLSDRTELVDLGHPDKPVRIATGQTYQQFYEPTLHQLALFYPPAKVERYTLDLEHLTVTPLPRLEVSTNYITEGHGGLELLDPARADGIIAIARWYGHKVYQGDQSHLAIFRAPSAATEVIRPSRELVVAELLAVDATGAMYVRDMANGPIIVRRDGKPDVKLAGVVASKLVPSHDGTLFAAVHQNEVAVFDAAGIQKWAHAMWTPTDVVFSTDDRTTIVQSAGGLVSFSATTGNRVAEACSFGFGLHGHPPATNPLSAEPVCGAQP